MSTFTELLSQPLAERLGWALVHFLWQGALVAGLLVVMLRILRAASAEAKYLAGCVALAMMAGLPIVTLLCLPDPAPSATPPPVVVESSTDRPVSSDLVAEEPFVVADSDTAASETPMAVVSVSRSDVPLSNAPAEVAVSWSELVDAKLRPWIPWFVATWLAGVLFLSLRLLASWRSAQRMRLAGTSAAPDRLTALLSQIAEQLGVRRAVVLLESTMIEVPAAIGWLRPVILLPVSAVTGLTESQIKAILAHELAHIRRCDYLVNLGQSVVETLLFYHPAVWWVSSQIRQEREHCCDDLAGVICGDRVGYAQALVRMEELRGVAGNVALAASGGRLTDRVRRLLGVRNRERASAWWLGGAMAVVVAATIVTGLWWTSAVEARAASSEVTTDEDAEKPDANGAPVLAGRVTDELGQPVSGASVRLQVAPWRWRWQDDPPVVLARTRSDSEGMYQLSLPDEWQTYEPFYQKQVKLWVSASESRLGLIDVNRAVLRKLQNLKDPIPTRRDLDVTVTSEQLPLRVVSPSGKAVADATVMAVYGHGRQTPKDLCNRTNADGRLVLPLVAGHPISEFWVISEPFGIQFWQRPEDILAARQENMPAELKLKPVTRLSGKIDMPSRDVVLDGRLTATTWGHPGNINEEPRGYARIVPNADGTYEVPAIVAGLLSFHHEYQREQYPSERQKWPWFLRAPQRMDVELKPDSPFEVDLAIEAGVVIRGRLLGADSRPLPHRSFLIHHGPQDRSDRYAETIKLATDQDGRFEARVMAGPITIRGDAEEFEFADVTFLDSVYEDGEVKVNLELMGEVTVNFESKRREAKPEKGTETEESPAAPEEDTTDAGDQAAPWKVRLRAIDEATGEPIPDAQFVVQWDKEETAYESNDRGEFVAEVPTRNPRYCYLKCRAGGYTPMRAFWRNGGAAPVDELPEVFTFPMGKGVSVGGTVKNDAGEPVAGATVKFAAGDYGSHPGRRVEPSFSDEYVTDEEGRWVCDIAPAKMDSGSIRANHPDYAQCRSSWSVDEKLDALRSKSLVVYVHEGRTVRGRITDAGGKPVAGAVLMQGIGSRPSETPSYESDSDGRFEISKAEPTRLVVVKSGFAVAQRDLSRNSHASPFEPVDSTEALDEVHFQLQPGVKITFRVTDTDGQPIPAVTVGLSMYGGSDYLTFLCRRANQQHTTDENGIWTWNSAPKGEEIYYDLYKWGYMDLRNSNHTVEEDTIVDVTLKRPQVVKGRVVDAKTKQPIESFVVQKGWLSGQWETVQPRYRGGMFEKSVPMPPSDGAYRYRVLAEGYETAVSDRVKHEEGEVTVNFELKRKEAKPEKVTESKEPPVHDADTTDADDQAAPWQVRLRAVDEATGKPISNAQFMVNLSGQDTPYRAGVQGVLTVEIPTRTPAYCYLKCRADGYPPMQAFWENVPTQMADELPGVFTFPMHKGISVGGLVLNDDGEPVEGATVRFMAGDRTSHPGRRVVQAFTEEYLTDQEGRWKCDIAPAELGDASIRADHPDYATWKHLWGLRDKLDALRDRSLVVYLHKAHTLRGLVTDPDGNPVSGAVLVHGIPANVQKGPFYRTDFNGRFEIPRVESTRLMVAKRHFAPNQMILSGDGFSSPFEPSQFTQSLDDIQIQLRERVNVTFHVVDTDGQPISGVQVHPAMYGGKAQSQQTDNRGMWTCDWAPKGEEFHYDFLRHGYAMVFTFAHTAQEDSTVEIVLKRPQVIKGLVLDDETRQPIESFALQRSSYPDQGWVPLRPRGRDGKYEVSVSAPPHDGVYRYRVVAEGYEPIVTDEVAFEEEGEVTLDFVLKRTSPRPEKVTESEEPPAAAAVDAVMKVVTSFDVVLKGTSPKPKKVTEVNEPPAAAADEVSPDPLLTVKVYDKETNKPIEKFWVVPGSEGGGGGYMDDPFSDPDAPDDSPLTVWYPDMIQECTNGQFHWSANRPQKTFRLRFEADGYMAELSPWIKKSDGKQEFGVAMGRASGITGQVLTPDGRPADGAVLAVTMPGRSARFQNGEFVGIDDPPPANLKDRWQRPTFVTADTEGRYRLDTEVGTVTIYAVHDAGIAEVPFAVVQEAGEIRLQPWAAMDGRVVWGDKPGANEELLLAVKREFGDYPKALLWQATVTTDAQGRFHVDKLPPWTVKVSRRFEMPEDRGEYLYPSQEFELTEGKSTSVVFGGCGRPVVGKLIGLKPAEEVTIQIEPFTPHGPGGYDNWLARALVYQSSFGPKLFRTKIPVAEDGTFRIDNVLPADYQLQMKAPNFRIFAAPRFTIEPMPGGKSDELHDLGEIQVKRH